MKLELMRQKIEQAKKHKAQYPYMVAAVIAQSDNLKGFELESICAMLGVSTSYKHQIRGLLGVQEALADMGYEVTNTLVDVDEVFDRR